MDNYKLVIRCASLACPHDHARPRPWLPGPAAERVTTTLAALDAQPPAATVDRLAELVAENQRIHDESCLNLNPATNRMNPRAEQMLAARLGSRASLGYPGDKYETGLEAIEQIEVIAAELAARVFKAAYAEVRVGSGALANLYSFMACCEPGDTVIAPPESIAGHVTHHADGAAGLYRLRRCPPPSTRTATPSTSTRSRTSPGPSGPG